MSHKYALGIDFGTLSGRAVVVDVTNGAELSSATLDYPHGVIDEFLPDTDIRLPHDFALQHPQDYLDVLTATIPKAVAEAGIASSDIIGVGIDFTACTILPVYADGVPL